MEQITQTNKSSANSNLTDIIIRDMLCPYCGKEKAALFNKKVGNRLAFTTPAYGLKWLLSVIYNPFYTIIHGFKFWEFERKISSITYVFCPCCGNTYSMAPPESVKEEAIKEPKFQCVEEKKLLLGVTTGIADYTGYSLLWIRFLSIIYAICTLVIPGILIYAILGCVFKSDKNDAGK